MKSAPSAASHSGQQKEKESVTGTEAGMQVSDPMEMSSGGGTTSTTALPANIRPKNLDTVRANGSPHTGIAGRISRECHGDCKHR